METDAGDPGLKQEGESERRRTEEDTLRRTQKVSINQYLIEVNRVVWCYSPTMSRRDWTLK